MAKVVAEGQQLALALEDAQLVQHQTASSEGGCWRGYCTLNHRKAGAGERLREIVFPVSELPWFLAKGLRQFGGEDLYIAQHSYAQRQRRTGDLLSLNLAHVDLDTYKSAWSKSSESQVVDAVLRELEAGAVPLPSYIVASGRGLQVKWLWTKPLAPEALPRWQAAHRWLVRAGGALEQFGADEKAILPTQILRVVGSVHQGAQAPVRVVWTNGPLDAPHAYDFEAWCAQVLPYTRDQVKQFKAKLHQYDAWAAENEANRRKLVDVTGRDVRSQARRSAWQQVASAIGTSTAALANMDDLVAGEIWGRRLATMEKLAALRYGSSGIQEGDRHEWCWIAANAFAWVNNDQTKPLLADVQAWAKKWVPSYTANEVKSAAAAVLKRAEKGAGGLYRMSEATFRTKLKVNQDELDALTPEHGAEEANRGAMGFEKMRGLSFEDYCEETKRRQSLAAQRTTALVREAKGEARAQARAMRASGATLEAIAVALSISVATAHRWVK